MTNTDAPAPAPAVPATGMPDPVAARAAAAAATANPAPFGEKRRANPTPALLAWLADTLVSAYDVRLATADLAAATSRIKASRVGHAARGQRAEVDGAKVRFRHAEHGEAYVALSQVVKYAVSAAATAAEVAEPAAAEVPAEVTPEPAAEVVAEPTEAPAAAEAEAPAPRRARTDRWSAAAEALAAAGPTGMLVPEVWAVLEAQGLSHQTAYALVNAHRGDLTVVHAARAVRERRVALAG